jgi:SpoVK/Ycf46/Vps4 family AAA+-type ATPase
LLPENIKSIELLFDEQMLETLSPLRQALSPEVLPRIKELSKARNVGVCALLYGHPGTGKTEWCYQLAKEYDLPIYEVNVSDIQDKWVGNSEKNARRVFNEYKRICKYYKKDVILLFNEADALFGKRLEAQQSVDQMNNALKNIFLEEMEKMDGILLATTNLSQSLDPAFERRFLFKLKFLKPNNSTQCRLWMKYFDEINEEQANQLSKHFDLSPAQISNVQRRLEIERILYPNIELIATIERLANTEKLEDPNDKKVMGF